MHDINVKMTKFLIAVAAISVAVIMISGMKIFELSYYWRAKYFRMQLDYAMNEIAFFYFEKGGITSCLKVQDDANAEIQSRQKEASSVPILLYHGIIDDPHWEPDDVNMRLEDFRSHMFALKKAGYRTITVEDYVAFRSGKKNLPEKSFMLTFDDGRKDSYYMADPILRTVGFVGVMHVITGRSLGEDNEKGTFHLSKTELEKMMESGRWEIQSHGRNDHDSEIVDEGGGKGHFLSNKLWLEGEQRIETDKEYKKRIMDDLLLSKIDIEKRLGITPLAYAFPFGDYGQVTKNFPGSSKVIQSFINNIFPVTFSQIGSAEFPVNYAGQDSPPSGRINVSSKMSAGRLLSMLENSAEKQTEYSDDFSRNNGWLLGWGQMGMKENQLILKSGENEDSALVFLDGSYLWRNYFAEADVRISKNSVFSFAARYADGNNYVACSYYDGGIVLTQKIDGENKSETKKLFPTFLEDKTKRRIGIRVDGDKASCHLDGKETVSGKITGASGNGGIGFMTWNTLPQKAYLIVSDLKVTKER